MTAGVGGAPNRLQGSLSAALDAVRGRIGAWQPVVDAWRASAAGRSLVAHVDARLAAGAVVYPASPLRSLELTPCSTVRVVILGQDPYHGPGQAEGLAFSVAGAQRLPPSLRNIFKEMQRDLGLPMPATGSLVPWAERGVLLLNTTLTVEDGQPASHARRGWEALTDALIAAAADDPQSKAFLLWGAHAQAKAALIESAGHHHRVLQCNHPSPLAALRPPVPFIGCGHFSAADRFLTTMGAGPVDWSLR